MAIRYTKVEKDETRDERVIPSEEFINRMVSLKKIPDQLIEKPKIESIE